MKPSLRRLAILPCILLLDGCFSQGPATRSYILAPVVEAPSARSTAHIGAPERQRVISVTGVRVPGYLDRPQIVTRDTRSRLQWDETQQWGSPLAEDLLRVLAMNLGSLLAEDRIVAAPYAAGGQPDYRIEVEIRSFERQHAGRVQLAAQWWITRGSDRSLIAGNDEIILSQPVPPGESYDQLVDSMSQVYGQLAQAIAGGIPPRGASQR